MVAGTALIAGTYGLVRLAYGLFLSDIQASVGLTSVQAGYVASGASVVYAVGALVGVVADRWPRLVVLAALGTASLGCGGHGRRARDRDVRARRDRELGGRRARLAGAGRAWSPAASRPRAGTGRRPW